MFLGFFTLGTTLAVHLQLAAGNAPVAADALPAFQVFVGTASTPIASGTLSSPVHSLTGWHLLSQALTTTLGFARGVYTVRVAYAVNAVAATQFYTFQVV